MLRVYVGAGESSNIEKDLDALVKVEGGGRNYAGGNETYFKAVGEFSIR